MFQALCCGLYYLIILPTTLRYILLFTITVTVIPFFSTRLSTVCVIQDHFWKDASLGNVCEQLRGHLVYRPAGYCLRKISKFNCNYLQNKEQWVPYRNPNQPSRRAASCYLCCPTKGKGLNILINKMLLYMK